MRKKLGIISIKKGDESKTLNIWGSCWKNEDRDKEFWGGISVNIDIEDINDFFPMVTGIMRKCPAFKLDYKEGNYGDKYRLSVYSKLSGKTLEWAVSRLKNINGKSKSGLEWEIKVDYNFKYVIDSNILKNI